MNRLLAVFAVVVPLCALAEPRVVVLPFTGPKQANAGRKQLVQKLCDVALCVPAEKVTKKNKLDPAKAKKEKVTHVVLGKMAGKKTELTVQTLKKKTLKKGKYTVGPNGRFFVPSLDAAMADLEEAIGFGAPPREKEPPPPPLVEKTPPVEEKRIVPPVEEKAPPEERAEAPAKEEKDEEAWASDFDRRRAAQGEQARTEEKVEETVSEPTAGGTAKAPLLYAELGTDMGPRMYAYDTPLTSNLRRYSAGFIFMPRLHAELYPLSRSMEGLPAGLGLELDYAFAVGLRSSPPDGQSYPTRLTRVDVAARLRMTPVEGSALVINPLLGYRSHSFATLPADDGSRLVGLADITYGALRLGAGVEQPVIEDKGVVFGELALLPILGTGPLKDYFPQSGGLGVEANAGFGYALVRQLQLRLGATLTRYGLGFTTAETDVYRANGASDLYVSGKLSLRYAF